jgi:hypothetical protein
MDRATLERYRHLAVTGAGPARHVLPNLKSPEQQLYAHLVQHAADHGTGLLLEQERIPWAQAYQQLTRLELPLLPFKAICNAESARRMISNPRCTGAYRSFSSDALQLPRG